jgi:hypothetical protein
MPNARIPNTTEEFSFFVDLKSTNATEAEVINAINTAGIVGVNIRDDLWVVEFVCESEAAVETAMNTVFQVEGKKPFEAIMPRHKTNRHLLIKVLNVPFRKEEDMKHALVTYWTQFGNVYDAAPYKFPGKPWLTKRWDILLELGPGTKKLEAPTVFSIDGLEDQLVCSWPSSKKACLYCRTTGHSTSSCPEKKPDQKVGASANPRQKIGNVGREQKRQESDSKVPPKTPIQATKPIVTPATIASSSTSTDMDIEATVAQSQTSPASKASEEPRVPFTSPFNDEELVQRRRIQVLANENSETYTHFEEYMSHMPADMHPHLQSIYHDIGQINLSFGEAHIDDNAEAGQRTPPTFVQTIIADPDTPRKGKKRQAKEDAWTPSLTEVRNKLNELNLCVGCWRKGHTIPRCPTKKGSLNKNNLGQVLRHPKFTPLLAAWSHQRRQKGLPWVTGDSEVVIPAACTKCHREGHTASECTSIIVCSHCKGPHLRIDCSIAPPYAYEQ